MLNTLLLNTAMLNSGTPTPFALTASDYDDIEFNDYSLQTDDIISSEFLAFSAPSRDVLTFKTPRADGGGWNGDYFRDREIKVGGIIEKATSTLLETELDTFKQKMNKARQYFVMKVNGEVRRIIATLKNPQDMFAKREGYHITFSPFSMTFLAVEPMWHAVDYESVTIEDIATLAYPSEIEVSGTYKAQPVIGIIVQAATAITALTFGNITNGDEVTITRTFIAGDVLVIDAEEKSLTVNGAEVEYDGVFPELEVGTNEFTITATGTSIEYTATVKYKPTYL